MLLYAPVDDVERVPQCAMLFIIAEKEECSTTRTTASKPITAPRVRRNSLTIPNITHYGVYTTERDNAHKLSQDWFDEHLKGVKPAK